MSTIPISVRLLTRILTSMMALCLFSGPALVAGQDASPAAAGTSVSGYRIAGIVLSQTDGHPLSRALVTCSAAKAAQKNESVVTSEDGKFEFRGVPAGKYALRGAKRGYIPAGYDQHEQFSTAIVTGAGVETEGLVLRLAPAAVIAGTILDEAGEPVRHAAVTVYRDDHSNGVDQILTFRRHETDDQGAYEVTGLMPGTYFLSASANPWYAVHPSIPPDSQGKAEEAAPVDRSLDVAYPLTYYPDVTDAEGATPIPVRGGEHLQVEIHLNPVPALHLLFRVPNNGKDSHIFPQLEQPTFDGFVPLQGDGALRPVTPGVVELTGIPAGRYNVRFYGGEGPGTRLKGIDLGKDGEEIDTSGGEALSNVKMTVQLLGETTLPPHLAVGLRSGSRFFAGAQEIGAKGEAEFGSVAAGRYEVLAFAPGKQYSVTHITAEGAEVSGHSVTVAAGSSPSVALTLIAGSLNVEGIAKRAGKAFAGAMVVLVPKNPETDRDLFRRDQSDLDGTFSLQNVVPGSYTVLAIENGWDLDWSKPGVIAAFSSHGRSIEVSNQGGRAIHLAEPVEVQSK